MICYLLAAAAFGAGFVLHAMIDAGARADIHQHLERQRRAVIEAAVAKDEAERRARDWRRRHAALVNLYGDPYAEAE